MRNSFKLLGAVAVAGVVATTGSAFTAANTGVDAAYVGYDDATISGVTVTNIEYKLDTADASKLASIVFTESEDVSTGYKATLTVNGPTTTQISCTFSSYTAATTTPVAPGFGTITCPTTGQNISTVTSVALTVAAI